MQRLLKIPFVRNRLYAKALEQFVEEQAGLGVRLRDETVAERLGALRTVLIDAPLVMEGDNRVRRVAAPLRICSLDKIKHQGAWMMLAAGVALGCNGYAPLENFAASLHFARERMLRQYPVIREIPYDDLRQIDTTIHRDATGCRAYAKGETSAILARCASVLDGKERPLEDADREQAVRVARQMEEEGLETLAFATKAMDSPDEYEGGMVFLGIVGTGDLPRAHAAETMEAFRAAGVRPVLMGDKSLSGCAVRASGVLRQEAGVMDAWEIDAIGKRMLRDAAGHADAFLGVEERHRERLVHALRADGGVAFLRAGERGGVVVVMDQAEPEPDAVLRKDGLGSVVELLAACSALVAAYAVE